MSNAETKGFLQATLPAGYTLYVFEQLASTMDEAHKQARLGAHHGTMILAKKQTKGRGRSGGIWLSQEGDLTFSVILKPPSLPQSVSWLSFLVCIAVGHALLPDLKKPADLQYKWPNDIFLNGLKTGGCLVEVERAPHAFEPAWVVVGVGLNITSAPQSSAFDATSVALHASSFDSKIFLARFCCELQEMLNLVKSEGFHFVAQLWKERSWARGRHIAVKVSEEQTLTGIAQSLNSEGHLVLLDDMGVLQTVTAGSILTESTA